MPKRRPSRLLLHDEDARRDWLIEQLPRGHWGTHHDIPTDAQLVSSPPRKVHTPRQSFGSERSNARVDLVIDRVALRPLGAGALYWHRIVAWAWRPGAVEPALDGFEEVDGFWVVEKLTWARFAELEVDHARRDRVLISELLICTSKRNKQLHAERHAAIERKRAAAAAAAQDTRAKRARARGRGRGGGGGGRQG